MNRQQAYNKVYQNLIEYRNLEMLKKYITPSDKFMNKSELGASVTGLGGGAATFVPFTAPAGLGAELAADVWDVGNAGGRALRGEWGDAALNLVAAVPYLGLGVAGSRIAKAANATSKVTKAANATSDVKKVQNLAKGSKVGKVVKGTGLLATGGLLANALLDDGGGEVVPMDPSMSNTEIKVETGDPGLYKLGSFGSEASPYAKSISSISHRENSTKGYNPFFTIPPEFALDYRRKNISNNRMDNYLPETTDYNLDNIYYKRAYKAVNKYLNSPQGKELNNHLNAVRSTIE